MRRATTIALGVALAWGLSVACAVAAPPAAADEAGPAGPNPAIERPAATEPTAKPPAEPPSTAAPPDGAPPATAGPQVRVRLGCSGKGPIELTVAGPYRIRAPGATETLADGWQLPTAAVTATAAGLQIGARKFAARRLEVEVLLDGALWVAGRRYRGHLRLVADEANRITAINVVDLEDYLASVLPCELPADFPEAAQRAQIIAARTYALYHVRTYGRGHDFDVYDTSRSQNYRGMETTDGAGRRLAVESPHSRGIVEATRGLVLEHGEKLFCGYYSATCGGHTANGDEVFGDATPSLQGVACDGCRGAPNYRWQRKLPRKEVEPRVEALLQGLDKPIGAWRSIRVDEPGGGRTPTVHLVGSMASHALPATRFHARVLGGERAPSAFFSATLDAEALQLEGRGWGHGVGLCQWGARGLARAGKSGEQILRHYYPGSQTRPIAARPPR